MIYGSIRCELISCEGVVWNAHSGFCGSHCGKPPLLSRWFPPGTPVSSTRKLISSSFHRLDMTLAVAEALNPNKTN